MLGIVGAMPEEVARLTAELTGSEVVERGMRRYHVGELWGTPVVLVVSRIGKVAAASTATHLVAEFGVTSLVMTGVAGAVDPTLRVGDLVVASRLAQHDLDASPIYPRFEAPLLGRVWFDADAGIRERLEAAARAFVDYDLGSTLDGETLHDLGIDTPRVAVGPIASGDRFIADATHTRAIADALPGTLCVEMEGAAVAQVGYEHGVPFGVIRAISDSADHAAADGFGRALPALAGAYTHGVMRRYLGG